MGITSGRCAIIEGKKTLEKKITKTEKFQTQDANQTQENGDKFVKSGVGRRRRLLFLS